MSDDDRTASLMTPARLAQLQVRPRTAASPAAWLDQMAADAGAGHVRRLVDLRRQLETQLGGGATGATADALQALSGALEQLDYGQLQPRGWLARATGKGKEAAAGFVGQVERILRAGEDLGDELRAVKKQQAQAGAVDRTLVEVDVEVRALDKIMEQGARWLQDMRNQLKTREAEGGDAAVQQQIQDDGRRCDMLVARLKLLRAVTSAMQQAVDRCKALQARRATVAASLQRLVDGEWKAWQERVAPVADQAQAGGFAGEGLERAQHAQQQLQAGLQQVLQDCAAVQSQEQAAAAELDAVQGPLQAAG